MCVCVLCARRVPCSRNLAHEILKFIKRVYLCSAQLLWVGNKIMLAHDKWLHSDQRHAEHKMKNYKRQIVHMLRDSIVVAVSEWEKEGWRKFFPERCVCFTDALPLLTLSSVLLHWDIIIISKQKKKITHSKTKVNQMSLPRSMTMCWRQKQHKLERRERREQKKTAK